LYQVPIAAGVTPASGTTVAQLTPNTNSPACSPVTDVYNANVSGGATEWAYVSVENNGVNSGCSNGGCLFNFEDTAWRPLTSYALGQEVLAISTINHKIFTQVVIRAGISGSIAPHWNDTAGTEILTDGTVHWINQGAPSAASLAAWQASQALSLGSRIIDGNGNVEVVTHAGTTGSGTHPIWSLVPGVTTPDNGVTWTNAGFFGSFVLQTAGGTSGIIIDNTVSTILEPGTSQIYFSTLGSQACGTTGTGGCAVQASQSALK
jgi:hypothetical protein